MSLYATPIQLLRPRRLDLLYYPHNLEQGNLEYTIPNGSSTEPSVAPPRYESIA